MKPWRGQRSDSGAIAVAVALNIFVLFLLALRICG